MKLESMPDDLPSDPNNLAHNRATPGLNITFSLHEDSPLRGEIQHLEQIARKNAEHHWILKVLQKQHDEKIAALKAEHTALKNELLLHLNNSNMDGASWKHAIDLAEQGALEELTIVKDDELKGNSVADRIAGQDEDFIDITGQDEDFIEEHLRSALENLFNHWDEEATKPVQSEPSLPNDVGPPDVVQQVQEAWDSQILDPQFLRRKIFALEKVFLQKTPIRHFDPRVDGAIDYNAEIIALKKKFADKEAESFKLRNQLSEALSLLEKARAEVEQLTDEDDSKNDIRSAHNPRLRVWLEELYTFSCDPHVEKQLEGREEKILREVDGDDDQHDESSELP